MVQPSDIAAPFYPSLASLGEFSPVLAADMPGDYQVLLDHDDHMTVTVEAYHGCLVDVRVVREHRDGPFYSRSSMLVCQSSGRVVQFGIMRINLVHLAAPVRAEIESHRAPLGRVLIRHNVLRHVELQQLWRIEPGPTLRDQLQISQGPAFGRSARIVVEGRPAVELLEIPRS